MRAALIRGSAAAAPLLFAALAFAQEAPGPDELYDLQGPLFEPTPWWQPWAHTVGLGVAVAVALAAIFLVARRLLHRPLSAHARASRAINATIDWAEADAIVTTISDAVRGFVAEVYGVHAPRKTSEEVLGSLSDDERLSSGLRAQLAEVLQWCDVVKFGQEGLREEELRSLRQSARQFIDAGWAEARTAARASDEGEAASPPTAELASNPSPPTTDAPAVAQAKASGVTTP